MRANVFRRLGALSILILSLIATACDRDLYLSESELAAYTGLFSSEADANNFISLSLPGQALNITFNNAVSPPTIQSTNLVALMRNYTTLGWVESFNRQVDLDRLNSELQSQIERWIGSQLQLYMGVSNAGVRLERLSSIEVQFLDRPMFAFRPDRQAIAFSLNIRLVINGTVDVDVLDFFSNLWFGVNGTYALTIDINNFNLSGEAGFDTSFADSGEIAFDLTPQPGTITVSNSGGSSAPQSVRDGIRDLIGQQLSRPLKERFRQLYDYFTVTGMGLTAASAQAPSRLFYTYRDRPELARPILHVVARAENGKLYHLVKTEGGESVISTAQPFPNLASRIENEPALFASDTDQLELAATSIHNELIYAHWRNEAWGYQTAFAPNQSAADGYVGKPAIIASAPGQVEIVAAGRDGRLWHMRRKNGVWLAPFEVPLRLYTSFATPPYRDPVAVQSGNKIVVVFVDALNRLLAIAFDLEPGIWGQPTSISTYESIRYAPAAVSSGEGQIDVVYAGQSGRPYHRILTVQVAPFPNSFVTGISIFGAEASIGGVLNASPSLVSSSFKQLDLVGRGTDGRLYHNHYVGPKSPAGFVDGRTVSTGWQGWTDLNGNFAGSLTFELMTGFDAASTSSGKVVVASIRQPSQIDKNSDQFVYHNTYDTLRYGTQPWKTVHWRGYEKAGNQRFRGQPAVAVTDRNSALMYIGNTLMPVGARMAESNAAAFSGFTKTVAGPPPADPVIVSSVRGQYDIFEVGFDGQLRHTRRSYRGSRLTYTFPTVNGQRFLAQPAVAAYGHGQIEMVAVAQNNTMYHWRYQNGTWSAATPVGGTVISLPILVHAGSGQLVLLAVGRDRLLYLWSFTQGMWSNSQQVPTGFYINPTLFGPLAASSWGDGSIDLGLVDSQSGALHHGRIGPGYFSSNPVLGLTPSRPFVNLGGILIDTPIVTAFSPTRINILAKGTDHVVYSNWSAWDSSIFVYPAGQAPPMKWSGYFAAGGYKLLMGGVAKLGTNELKAAGIDPSGRLMLSHFSGGNWLQFQPVLGQDPSTLLQPPLYRPAITAFNH